MFGYFFNLKFPNFFLKYPLVEILSFTAHLCTHRVSQESLAGFTHSADGVVHIPLTREAVNTPVQGLRHGLSHLHTHKQFFCLSLSNQSHKMIRSSSFLTTVSVYQQIWCQF